MIWWWQLQFWQWVQSGKAMPLRRTAALLVWWLPCVAVPLVLVVAGRAASAAGLEFLLSLDVPLALALAAMSTVDALGVAAHAAAEDWLWPPSFRPARLRWIARLRWLLVARWPAGLALAGLLLASGAAARPELLTELLLMVFVALAGGASLAWTLRGRSPSSATLAIRPRRARGLAALSWVALHETRDRLEPGRLAVLAVPALLLAPLGAMASDAVKILVVWVPLLYIATACHEAGRNQAVMRRWLRATGGIRVNLTWWVWRHVALGIALGAALLLVGAGAGTRAPGRPG